MFAARLFKHALIK